jgi:hypothetical protein
MAMPAESAQHPSAGILVSLDALVIQRADQPQPLEDATVALRRIGWIGRPIILVGHKVAGRELPEDPEAREGWVRASVGRGAYAVVAFDDPSTDRGTTQDGRGVEQWRALRESQGGTWLLTDQPRQVGAARQAGLKVILIGASDPQARVQRPDYQARDLRDAVGHMLAMDVFAPPPSPARKPGSGA